VHGQFITNIHDPWLNWDVYNYTAGAADDFHIIVDTPNWVPTDVYLDATGLTGFPNYTTVPANGGQDTGVQWSGTSIPQGNLAHIGIYMEGSGPIVDAFWTSGGTPAPWYDPNTGSLLFSSLPITYERTFVEIPQDPLTDDPEVWMQLSMPSELAVELEGNEDAVVGWGNVQGFRDIPTGILSLELLNSDLDLATLLPYDVTDELLERNSGDLISSEPIWWYEPESFFDVSFGTPEFTGDEFQSLLYAEAVIDLDGPGVGDPGIPIGGFWNLNNQSPEPGTALLLAVAGLVLISRRRRRS
jgi:hypothetical protein